MPKLEAGSLVYMHPATWEHIFGEPPPNEHRDLCPLGSRVAVTVAIDRSAAPYTAAPSRRYRPFIVIPASLRGWAAKRLIFGLNPGEPIDTVREYLGAAGLFVGGRGALVRVGRFEASEVVESHGEPVGVR